MSEEYIDSSKISKDTQDLLDEYSKLRKSKYEGVVYTALDETKDRGLDWGYLQRKAPGWCWDKLRSVMTKVTIQADGMLRKGPVPIYYSAHEADDHGRFPSHPGYKDPNWILPKSDT